MNPDSAPLFPVHSVTSRVMIEREDEYVGSKRKFWFRDEDGKRLLFKQGRDNEDWSEKVTAELGRLLGIPCAAVDLAEYDGARGIVSPSFLQDRVDQLQHGNELLLSIDPQYPSVQRYRVPQHTVAAAMQALERFEVGAWRPAETTLPETFNGQDVFVGYLLFDAWIGNTDRHHENWAVVRRRTVRLIAPSYDHASSLGRNEPAHRVKIRLSEKDHRCTVSSYAEKCASAFYREGQSEPLPPAGAFVLAAERRPDAGSYWRGRLAAVSDAGVKAVLNRIPPSLWSNTRKEFAYRLLQVNRDCAGVYHG